MGKNHCYKIRRHTYSMPELRLKAQSRVESRSDVIASENKSDFDPYARENLDDFEMGDYESWKRIEGGQVGWPASYLPEGCEVLSFFDLALTLAESPRGYVFLEGFDRDACGLEHFLQVGWDQNIGRAFSFCINSITYTAFENPNDSYRSSMGFLVARADNWCKTTIKPCALLPQFVQTRYDWADDDGVSSNPKCWRAVPAGDSRAGHGDILELIDPSTQQAVLSVGTRRSDDYYPSFTGYVAVDVLKSAYEAGIAECFALADSLKKDLEQAQAPKSRKRL